ncbi:hypothetical protein SCLCIDRAFT_690666 [Scleroderma citrinum Foug A]|uniref:Uncharacterized protein n=1 Tax=Scleroderma citrinum Foug A TaxID=1036808 RepID=A0A0C2ZQF3_9AGAM|nr:hypothetical protein SCLCIDRAFT_690666 [Scleroderma citrinum Foug A]
MSISCPYDHSSWMDTCLRDMYSLFISFPPFYLDACSIFLYVLCWHTLTVSYVHTLLSLCLRSFHLIVSVIFLTL